MSHVPPPGLAARWPDVCPQCPTLINVGDRVVYQRGQYVHVGCVGGAR